MREKQHPKATKNTCAVTARLRLRAQDSDQLQEYNRWGLSQQPGLHWQHILFSREYYFSSRQTNTTSGAKNPCLFLLCITFNICGTRAQLYPAVTRVTCSGTGADVIERFPLPQNIFAADSRSLSVCVRCKSLSEPELVPSAAPNYSDIGAYNELETPGQDRGSVHITHGSH